MSNNITTNEENLEQEFKYFQELLKKYDLPSLNIEAYKTIRAANLNQAMIAIKQTPFLNITDIIFMAVITDDIMRSKMTAP